MRRLQQRFASGGMRLNDRLRRNNLNDRMSALGQKQTLQSVRPMSAYPQKRTSSQSHLEAMRGLISLGSAKITSALSPGYRHPRGSAAGEPRRRIRSTKYCTVPKQPTSPSSTRADSNSSLISPPRTRSAKRSRNHNGPPESWQSLPHMQAGA